MCWTFLFFINALLGSWIDELALKLGFGFFVDIHCTYVEVVPHVMEYFTEIYLLVEGDPSMYGSNILHLLTCSTFIDFPLMSTHPLEGCTH